MNNIYYASAAFILFLLLLFSTKSCGIILHSFLIKFQFFYNLQGQQLENLVYVCIILCASFYKLKVILFCQSFSLFSRNLSISLKVCFWSNKNHMSISISDFLDLINPTLYMIEADGISDWESEDDAMCPFIEGFCYISKSLLPCRIPNVERDMIVIEFYPLNFEIYANCAEIVRLEGVLAIAN